MKYYREIEKLARGISVWWKVFVTVPGKKAIYHIIDGSYDCIFRGSYKETKAFLAGARYGMRYESWLRDKADECNSIVHNGVAPEKELDDIPFSC